MQERIYQIAKAKNLYLEFLNYIYKKTNNNELLPIIEILWHNKSKWMVVASLLTKGFLTNFSERIRNNISISITEIQNFENYIYENLKNILHGKSINADLWKKSSDISDDIIEYEFVDLTNYYNNIAFHSSTSTDCSADFTKAGQYFVRDDAPSGQIIVSSKLKFNFPVLSDNNYDNIACENQIITVSKNVYNGIMILGTAETENFVEFLRLNFMDSVTNEIRFRFSYWQYDEPIFNEEVFGKAKSI